MMKPNDFCVNDVKFRCVWGSLTTWDALNEIQKERKDKIVFSGTVEESKSRMDGYCKRGGCNSFKGQGDSVPFSFWTRQDILRYIVEHNIEISQAYGEIKQDENGMYYNTGAQRTGCPVCMFGMERDEPGNNRFQKLYYEDNRRWKQVVFDWGYKEVLDYFIENGFKNYQYYPAEILKKMELEKKGKENEYQYTIKDMLENLNI